MRRGYLTDNEADRCAVALGYLPADLWPERDDYVLDVPATLPYGTYRPHRWNGDSSGVSVCRASSGSPG